MLKPPRVHALSLQQAQSLIRDLHKPTAWIYWTDFLLTIISGHALFHLVLFAPKWLKVATPVYWTIQGVMFIAAALLYLRAAMFTHEMVHLRKGTFNGFRFAWNLLCGIPFLIPSFTYYPHIDHHRRKSYGTEHDGEYIDLSNRSPWAIVGFLALSFVIPIAGFLRFSILTPIGWLAPSFRNWLYEHASTMVMDPTYVRYEASPQTRRVMLLQEIACFIFCVWLVVKAPLILRQWYDPIWLQAYLMGVTVVMLNAVRTLGAHRWTAHGEELTFEEQLLDSVNYPDRPWVTELWGPTGTRYHALHHLFPTIPYHNLGIAHRRLMAGLPEDSPYRLTNRVSLTEELISLWKRSSEASHESVEQPAQAGIAA